MSEQVGWVPTGSGEVFAALHLPARPARATAVVLVPPFGWEGVSAARHLRGWARRLAAAGYPVVRYHPPGAGDSTGEAADQDLGTWARALADLVAHTRVATGCSRIAVVGLGHGGLVALRAVHDGTKVEDLVLWATPVRGRLLLRELRAFAALTGEPGDAAAAPWPPTRGEAPDVDGVLWVHGYPLGARAQEQLAELDAAALDLTGTQRALVLGRGTLPHDARLAAALEAAGAEVTGGPGPGYDDLTVEPRLSQPATAVEEQVRAWLPLDEASTEPGLLPTAATDERRLDLGAVDAVLTRAPDATLTAVFVGAGATPRSGPNRLWAEAARRWAGWGVASVRLDLHGVGEAPGDDAWGSGPEGFYDEAYRPQVAAALDEAVTQGLPDRFLLVGLCSGGFWSAQLALADPRVAGVVVLNTISLVWPPPLLSAESRQYLRSRQTWARFLKDRRLRQEAAARARRSAQLALARLRPGALTAPASTRQVLEALDAAGTPVWVGVSPGEASLPDLQELATSSGIEVRCFDGPEGAHTLAPPGLRRQAEALLDDAVRTVLARRRP